MNGPDGESCAAPPELDDLASSEEPQATAKPSVTKSNMRFRSRVFIALDWCTARATAFPTKGEEVPWGIRVARNQRVPIAIRD